MRTAEYAVWLNRIPTDMADGPEKAAKEATLQTLRRVCHSSRDDYTKALVLFTRGVGAIGLVKSQLPTFSMIGKFMPCIILFYIIGHIFSKEIVL